MKDKTIFLDRDGTINVYGNYPHKISDLKFIPSAIEGLKKLQSQGYKFIIITNQAGIGRGLYSEQSYFAFRDEMRKRLKDQDVIITAEYFCPHHPEKGIGKYKIDCKCRKPKTGMLEQAARELRLNLDKCWLIGDNSSDIQAGKNAHCRTIHVLTGEEKTPLDYANFVAKDLVEAADYILKNS